MRILQINKFGYERGGAERYMFSLAEALRQRGHEVEYFFMSHSENLSQRYSKQFPPELDFRNNPKLPMVLRVLWSRKAAQGLKKLICDYKPDLIHLHNTRNHLSSSIFPVLSSSGIPVVQTLHDYDMLCPAHHLYRSGSVCSRCIRYGLGAAVLSRCLFGTVSRSALAALTEGIDRTMGWTQSVVSAFICPSHFLMQKMREGGVTKLHYLPHFVTLPTKPAARDGGYLLYMGRLEVEKGVETLLRAMVRLDNTRLVIVGEGSLHESLLQLVLALGLEKRIEFTGQLARDRAMELMNRASMLVFPSIVYENAPLAVYEALAAGVPVLASAPGGAEELVNTGAGYTFPAGDVLALLELITKSLADPEQLQKMAQTGRRRAQELWSEEVHIQGLMRIYGMVKKA